MKPLRFEPVSYDYLWGRELWLLSPIAGKESLCNGKPLSAYIAEYKERLLGKRSIRLYGERFPLLIKDIKSRQQLSVQVHPDDQMAHTKGLPNGKSEIITSEEVQAYRRPYRPCRRPLRRRTSTRRVSTPRL